MKSPKTGADDFIASGHAEVDLTSLPGTEAIGEAAVSREGDDFLFDWPGCDVQIEVTMVREHGEGIAAELAVSLAGRELHWGRLALASTLAKGTLARRLAQQHRALPWGTLVEHACREAARAMRDGAPAARLEARPFSGPRFLLDPFVWHSDCSFIFADGGTGKGYVALVACLAGTTSRTIAGIHPRPGRGLRALYLDWESSKDDLDDRLYRLGQGLEIDTTELPIYRLGMDRPLVADLVRVRAECTRVTADLLVIDSWMPACGFGRDTAGADTAVGAFAAVRSLDRPALAIAHMSKVMADQKGAARIYGSVFNHNLSRNVWEVKRAEDSEPGEILLGCYHTKVNEVGRRKPFGLRFAFDGEDGPVTVSTCPLTEGGADLLDKLPLSARLLSIVATGALTIEEMAEHTKASEDTIGRTVRRLASQKRMIKIGDAKPFRWGKRV